MLGKTNLVIPTLESYPEQVFANGPHGFTSYIMQMWAKQKN